MSTAWSAAFEIKNLPEGPLISAADKVALAPPNGTVPSRRVSLTAAPRATSTSHDSSTTRSYTIAELNAALQGLGILEQMLSQLQAQILRDLVAPVIASQTLVSEGFQTGNDVLRFSQKDGASLTDVVSGIRDLVQFMENAFSSPLKAVTSFLSSFSEALFQQVLQQIIDPSMPRELSKLPPWLTDVDQCALWEQEGPENSNSLVLRRFLDEQAGNNWLARHRAAGLLETRSLVYEGWKNWDFRVEERKTEVSSLEEAGGDANEEGWGFDDDLNSPNPALASSEGGDGWGFDDLASTPVEPAPAPKVKAAREAKRLGKKLSSKHASATTSQETLVEDGNPQGASPQPTNSELDAPLARTGSGKPASPEPGAPKGTSSVRVSVATDAALSLLSSRLLELQEVESLR